MGYNIALQFEDGVTRIVACNADEPVADAAYRAKVNIPLDCRDGACGTCKSFCESGQYEMIDYVEDAMTEEEAEQGFVLTCKMRPKSDCVVKIASTSAACKIEATQHEAVVSKIDRSSPTTVTFSLTIDKPISFLPGQYVNLEPPASGQYRAYSFSSPPNQTELSFLIRDVPGGLMSAFMRAKAAVGDRVKFIGPYGSFYLRPPARPILMLAGGTGLAPFLSMLRATTSAPPSVPIRLAYGVNTNADLVELETLDELAKAIPSFSYFTVVVDANSGQPKTGYVTDHLAAEDLNAGDVDVYVCGPPPMVEGVRKWMGKVGVQPKNFYFEKFSAVHEAAAA